MKNLMIYIVILAGLVGLPLAQMSSGCNPIVINVLHAAFVVALISHILQYVGACAAQIAANRGDAGPYLQLMSEAVYNRTKLSALITSYVVLAGCGYIWTAVLFGLLYSLLILIHCDICESVKVGKLKGIDAVKGAETSRQ